MTIEPKKRIQNIITLREKNKRNKKEIKKLQGFKDAWEELVKSKMSIFGLIVDDKVNCYYNNLNNKIKELEQKNNLSDNND